MPLLAILALPFSPLSSHTSKPTLGMMNGYTERLQDCMDVVTPHLLDLIPYLFTLLDDAKALENKLKSLGHKLVSDGTDLQMGLHCERFVCLKGFGVSTSERIYHG